MEALCATLYGPTFHVTPVDLCTTFQCNLYNLYAVSCLVEINCLKLFQIDSVKPLRGSTSRAFP